ncbi:MAG TPA: phosphatase PAP2-related protein [Terriglobia bacterium]|nr:phosphatase PAP2-related protein [Terriglobia bacterium]
MENKKGPGIAIRLVLAALGIGLWFGTQALISQRPLPASGIGDGLHQLTAPLNLYFQQHPRAANALLIVSSSFIDMLAIFVLARWVFGSSVRPFLGLLILLGLRQLIEALCALPMPPNMIWHYPGFPTLLVTYSVANDYYFSGHTSIAVFAATELARLGKRWLTVVGIVLVIFEITTVLTLRAHYTMDVFTGLIAALYVAHLSERISPPIDRWLATYLAHADVRPDTPNA